MHRPPKSTPKPPPYPYPHSRKANTPDHFPHSSQLRGSQHHNKSTTVLPGESNPYPYSYQLQQQQQQQHVKSMRDTVPPSASVISSPLEVENAEYLEIVRGKGQPVVDFRIGGADTGIRGGFGAVSGRSFKIRNVGAFKTINYNINRSVKQNSFPFKLSNKPNTISPSLYPYSYPNQPTKSSTTLHHPLNKQSIINIKNIEKLDQYQRKLQLQLQQQRQQQLWIQGQQQQELGSIKQNNYNQHMKQQYSGLQKSRIQARLWPYPQYFCLGDLSCKIYSSKVGAPINTTQHQQQRPHFRSRQTIRTKPRQQSQPKCKLTHTHAKHCPAASSIPVPTPTIPTATHPNWCIILSQSIFNGSLSQQLNILKLKGLVDGIRRHHPLVTIVVRLNVVHSDRDVEGVVGKMRDRAVGVDWVIWGKSKYHENINVFDISSITNANTPAPVPISNDKQNMSMQIKPHNPNNKPLDRFIIIQDNHEVVRNIYYKGSKCIDNEAGQLQQTKPQDGNLGVDDTYNQQSQFEYLTIQNATTHYPHIVQFSPSKSKSKSRQAQQMSNKKSRRRYQVQLQLQLQQRQMKRFMYKSVNDHLEFKDKSQFNHTTPINISNITCNNPKPKPKPSRTKASGPKYLYLKFNGLPHLLKFIHKFRIDQEKQLVYLQTAVNGNESISGDNVSNPHNQSVNSFCSGGKGEYFIDDTLGVFGLQALREKIRIYNIKKNISMVSNKAKLQRSCTNPIQKNPTTGSGKKVQHKYSSKQKQKSRNASYSKSKNTHNISISNTINANINASSKELNQKKDKNSEIVARNEELKIKMVQFIKILVEENKNKIRDKDRRKNSSAAYILQPKEIPMSVHQLSSYSHILNPRPQSSHKHKPQSADSTLASSTQNANTNSKMNDQFCYKSYLQQAQSKSSHQIVSELIKNNLYNQKQISKFYERAVGSGFGGLYDKF